MASLALSVSRYADDWQTGPPLRVGARGGLLPKVSLTPIARIPARTTPPSYRSWDAGGTRFPFRRLLAAPVPVPARSQRGHIATGGRKAGRQRLIPARGVPRSTHQFGNGAGPSGCPRSSLAMLLFRSIDGWMFPNEGRRRRRFGAKLGVFPCMGDLSCNRLVDPH